MSLMATIINRELPENLKAILKITLSACLYGFLGCFGIKLLEEHFSISTMLFWRFFIASLWILPNTLKQAKHIQFEQWPLLLLVFTLGSITYCSGSALYFMASQLTGTGLAMVIFFTYPLFVIILAWLLEKRPVSLYMLLAIAGVVIGMLFLESNQSTSLNLFGIFLALLNALCYGIYIYSSQHSARAIPSNQITLLICAGSALIFLIYSLMTHSFAMPSSLKAWLYIIGIGVIATAIPIQLMLQGLQVIHSSKASILTVFEPLVTMFIGVLWLNESLSTLQVIGALIILSCAVAIQFES